VVGVCVCNRSCRATPACRWIWPHLYKQETCVSRSFSRPITSAPELREAVATYVSRTADKLRRQRAGALTMFVRTSPFAPRFYS